MVSETSRASVEGAVQAAGKAFAIDALRICEDTWPKVRDAVAAWLEGRAYVPAGDDSPGSHGGAAAERFRAAASSIREHAGFVAALEEFFALLRCAAEGAAEGLAKSALEDYLGRGKP